MLVLVFLTCTNYNHVSELEICLTIFCPKVHIRSLVSVNGFMYICPSLVVAHVLSL